MYQQLPVGLSQTADVNALLHAYDTPNDSQTSMPVNNYTPVQAIPGGNVVSPNTDTTVYNRVQIPSSGRSLGAIDAGTATNALLWVGGGLGAAYLISRMGGAGSVGKKKGSMLVPLVLVAGVAAWYFMGNKDETAAVPDATDPNRAQLLSVYVGQPKQIAAVSAADSETLRKWALVMTMWNNHSDPYKFDLNGNPTTDYAGSIGAWWESFAKINGF